MVKHVDSISDITFIDPHNIEIGKRKIGMESTAIKGLCDELKIPPRYYSNLHKQSKEAWNDLTKMISKLHNKPTNLVSVNGKIIGVLKNVEDLTKHHEVIQHAESLLKAYPDYRLQHYDFNGMNLSLNFVSTDSFNTGQWRKKNDLFRYGFVMRNNLIKGFNGQNLIERMICTNLAYVVIPGLQKRIRHLDAIEDFVGEQNKNEIAYQIQNRLDSLRNHNASLQEIINVSDTFRDESRPNIKDYLSQLRVVDIADVYGLTEAELNDKPALWRSTVETPYNLYDVINWITYIARHDQNISVDEATKLRIKAGDMLFDTPDLASVAQKRVISSTPWILNRD